MSKHYRKLETLTSLLQYVAWLILTLSVTGVLQEQVLFILYWLSTASILALFVLHNVPVVWQMWKTMVDGFIKFVPHVSDTLWCYTLDIADGEFA